MVRVSITRADEDITKPKACWYPFQKQIDQRRTLTPGSLVCSNRSIDKNIKKQGRSHHKNGKHRCGSVSTATETDTSFLSEETRTTLGTGMSSSHGTYHNNNNHNNNKGPTTSSSSPRSHWSSSRKSTTADGSYKINPIIENSFVDRISNHIRNKDEMTKGDKSGATAYFVDDDYDSDDSILAKNLKDNSYIHRRQPLAKVDRNCMTKEIWGDEAVRGGGFACGSSVKEPNGTATDPFGTILRFISQNPEDEEDGTTPLRRILCSSVPFRNPNPTNLCRHREAIPGQDALHSYVVRMRHKYGTDVEERTMRKLHKEEPNFYVEVESMQDEQKGNRDFDEIKAANGELDEDFAIARTSSLVDKDISFSESGDKDLSFSESVDILENYYASSGRKVVRSTTDAGSISRRQREKQKQKQDNLRFQFHNEDSPSRVPTSNSKVPKHDLPLKNNGNNTIQQSHQAEKIGRQNQLLSEMVSDRVLSMRADNEVVPRSMRRSRDLQMKPSETYYRDQDELIDHGQSKDPYSSRSLPRKISPTKPASSFQQVNVSELTEASLNQLSTNLRTSDTPTSKKNESIHRRSFHNAMQPTGDDESHGDWQQSEIGIDEEKFDDNFWKEENDDLASEAFAKFGSENDDSVFDDLKSQFSSQFST